MGQLSSYLANTGKPEVAYYTPEDFVRTAMTSVWMNQGSLEKYIPRR